MPLFDPNTILGRTPQSVAASADGGMWAQLLAMVLPRLGMGAVGQNRYTRTPEVFTTSMDGGARTYIGVPQTIVYGTPAPSPTLVSHENVHSQLGALTNTQLSELLGPTESAGRQRFSNMARAYPELYGGMRPELANSEIAAYTLETPGRNSRTTIPLEDRLALIDHLGTLGKGRLQQLLKSQLNRQIQLPAVP